MTRKNTTPREVDWRYRVVTSLAEDAVLPSGKTAIKGTAVSVSAFLKHGKTTLSIGDPSAPALYLSLSHKAYSKSLRLHPFRNSVSSTNEYELSTKVYDYLEQISAAVIFAFSALEAFANEAVPGEFTHETKKRSGIFVVFQKDSIERHISLDEKLGDVLPKALNKPSPRGSQIWSDYVLLRRLRDRLIHLKSKDRRHTNVDDPFPISIWSDLSAPNQPSYPSIAKNMIIHSLSADNNHWLKFCPF